jgi:glycosyltransferase involved in cell wall biosynthesis
VISIVSPVYGCHKSIRELVVRVAAVFENIGETFEIILVDDRCPYNSWAIIEELAADHETVTGIRLSRNFGQHAAIYAGLQASNGDQVLVMDCDLQDVPEEIPKLISKANEGYDVVRALRSVRHDSLLRRTVSKAFYATLSFLTGVQHSAEIANFGIYSRKTIDAVLSWREDHLYFPTAIQWVGFKSADLEVDSAERKYGESSYDLNKLLSLASGIIVSYSDKPLRLIAYLGMLISALSFGSAIGLGIYAFVIGFQVPGWASVVVSLWLLSGLILFAIGLSSVYLGQALRESKKRPNYLIDEFSV